MSQESQLSQSEPGGNTKTPGVSKGKRPFPNQLYCWLLTIPYEDVTASQLSQHLRGFCKKFKFQGEIGSETGYKHWQVCISLKTKEYFETVKNLFTNSTHIEGVKNYFAAMNYCGKDDTRIEGPYDENSVFIKTISELRPWQESLKNELLLEPEDRKILWCHDNGNTGKTQFCKYMAINHGASIISNAKRGDMAYALPDNPKIVLINFSRSMEDFVNYGAIEEIKDGMLFSTKYESKMKIFNSPHVVIFANFKPDIKALSNDRWDIREIKFA